MLCNLHKDPKDPDDTFARQEYALMKAQMDMEAESTLTVWQMLKAPSMRKRLILGFITMLGGQLTGVLVIGSKLTQNCNRFLF